MAVTIVSEREHLKLVAPADAAPVARPPKPSIAFPTEQTIAVLSAIAAILAVRLILLVAVVVSAALAYEAVKDGSVTSIVGSGVFDVLVLVPITVLTWKKG